jgi:hypothetical protein
VVGQTRYSTLEYKPTPLAHVITYNEEDANDQIEQNDATAAYTHALIWSMTRDRIETKWALRTAAAWKGSKAARDLKMIQYIQGTGK